MLPTMFQFKCRDINLRLRCETFPGFQQRPGVSFFFEVDHDKPVTGICILLARQCLEGTFILFPNLFDFLHHDLFPQEGKPIS